MTGRSNSATTSQKMWMLSASRARRWSRRRSVVTSGDNATVDIQEIQVPNPKTQVPKYRALQTKKPGILSRAFVQLCLSGCYPNSWTASAGTDGVLIQQAQVQQQFGRNTVPRLYSKRPVLQISRYNARPLRLQGVLTMSPTTLLGLLASSPADRTAIVLPEQNLRITYGNLRDQVRSVAEALAAQGIRRGDRVGMALPNGLPTIVAFLAASEAGTAAPLNPAYREEEFRFYLEDTSAKVLLLPPTGADDARRAAEACKVPVVTVDLDADGRVTVDGAGRQPYEAPGPNDVALILHTSGSTGRPKRVPLTHANLSISSRNVAGTYDLSPSDVSLCVMPLFHVHGLVASTLATLATGGTVVVPAKFSPLSFWRIVRDTGATWYSAVPTIHQLLLARAEPGSRPAGAEKLRFIRSCSAALPPPVMAGLEEAFGAPVLEAYGMTEAAHQMASNPLPPAARKPGSVEIGRA